MRGHLPIRGKKEKGRLKRKKESFSVEHIEIQTNNRRRTHMKLVGTRTNRLLSGTESQIKSGRQKSIGTTQKAVKKEEIPIGTGSSMNQHAKYGCRKQKKLEKTYMKCC